MLNENHYSRCKNDTARTSHAYCYTLVSAINPMLTTWTKNLHWYDVRNYWEGYFLTKNNEKLHHALLIMADW